jgi:hypothetical protein
MPMVIVCGGCKRKLKTPDALAGKVISCPNCAARVRVAPPAPTEVASAAKPGTKEPMSADEDEADLEALFQDHTPVGPSKKSLPKMNAESIKEPLARADPERNGAFEPEPKPKPIAVPSPSGRPTRRKKSADDDENSGPGKLVIFGGAFVLLFLICAGGSYLLFGGSSLGRVTGTVTMDGQPLEAAEIVFHGEEDPKLPSIPGKTDKDGVYTLAGEPGIAPGKYKIVILKLVMPDGKIPEGPAGEKAREDGLLKNVAPADYGDRDKTTLRAVIVAGNNKIDFPLKAAP